VKALEIARTKIHQIVMANQITNYNIVVENASILMIPTVMALYWEAVLIIPKEPFAVEAKNVIAMAIVVILLTILA